MAKKIKTAPAQTPAPNAPIGEAEYTLIADAAQQPRPGEEPEAARLRAAVDIAVIRLMHDCLLRVGVAAAVRWHDLHRERDGSGLLTTPKSKTNPAGYVVYVSATAMSALDEMRSIKQAMGIDDIDDRIFQMGSKQVTQRIREACSFAGLKGKYGGSSPRIGMLQDLVRSGVPTSDLTAAARSNNPAMTAGFMYRISASRGAVAQ